MKISFDFPIGEVVRIVEAGSKFYGLTGHIIERRNTGDKLYKYRVSGFGFDEFIEAWKLEKL